VDEQVKYLTPTLIVEMLVLGVFFAGIVIYTIFFDKE
jgi:hypothetical protein